MFLWLKAFHVIAVICWFAGLFYLPRLFVYHADTVDAISIARFKIMEKRLYHYIMTPSAIATVLLGAGLMSMNFSYYFSAPWMRWKLACVGLLIIYHLLCGRYVHQFKHNRNVHTHRFYRIFNEVPSLLLVVIVILVVVRP